MVLRENGSSGRDGRQRVAILHPGMDVKGGAENIVVWLADGMRSRGHDVRIFADTYDASLWPASMADGLDVALFPRFRISRMINSKRLQLRARTMQLARMLRGFDLVITQHPPTYSWATQARLRAGASWRVIWLCQEPMRRLYFAVTDSHLMEYRKYSPGGGRDEIFEKAIRRRNKAAASRPRKVRRNMNWDRRAVDRCDMVLANSAFTAGNVERIFDRPAEVCHLGIPLPAGDVEFNDGDYVAVLTTFHPLKNVHNVIRSVPIVKAMAGCEGIRLRIAGQGRERDTLETLAAELGVADRVEFVGRIPDGTLPEFFRNARVVVYCPVDEPFGLVPIEAMARKTPVVVSNHGGPVETVAHGESGLHVNPFDPREIAAAVAELHRDRTNNRKMAEAGYRKVFECFSLDAFIDRFETIVSATRSPAPSQGASRARSSS